MFNVINYENTYILKIGEGSQPPTWEAEAPIVSKFIELAIEDGNIDEPGEYVIRFVDIGDNETLIRVAKMIDIPTRIITVTKEN
jgi:hypothetical protein